MSEYRSILAAVELDGNGERVLRRARELAALFGARLVVVHVVEYVAIDSGEALMAAPPDFTQQLLDQARAKLDDLCDRCAVPRSDASVTSGGVTSEIMRLARDQNADLIVVGHHPRRGLAAWFSHTEQDVLQRAPCDVLALSLAGAT